MRFMMRAAISVLTKKCGPLRNLLVVLALCFSNVGVAAEANLDQLLDQIRDSSQQMSKANQDREARFLREKNRQAARLAEAESARAAADARVRAAKARYDRAQTEIAALRERLQGRVGDSAQIFAAVADASRSLRASAADSMVTPQFPDRLAELDEFAEARELPSVDEIERLWFLYAQQIVESGKTAQYPAPVFAADGTQQSGTVTRVGEFAAFADGRYLSIEPGSGRLAVLTRQPSGYTGLIDDFGDESPSPIMIDPSHGALLRLAAERPSLFERVQQGGAVGYTIIVIGLIGAAMALYQFVYLMGVGRKVQVQLADVAHPRDDNPLGRVLACLRDEESLGEQDPEVLETKLSEAVLRETPKLERYQSALKMIVAAGPLLGLLGTVVGMIMTFQVITELGTGDPKVMAGGISHAMVATVLGLLIAIPLLFVNSFLGARSRMLTQILDEQAAGLLVRKLEALQVRHEHA
jgi:biopolymer transport protein ExbB